MKEYKKVNLKTVKDFERAERLQAQGWKPLQAGSDTVLLEREKKGEA